jgi:NADH-quinone oxidoreductase subunit L
MVCRLSPLFVASPTASAVVTYVGAATAFFAATVGTCQTDIKRVIAYSTCSQLGYMFFAAGVGAYNAAMFHLFTHAFFKALLFLGAGSVIHAMHHEQDMRYYGGLRKHIPLTFWAMLAGTLAITGVGIAGLFGFAGFYSKDAIIESTFAAHSDSGGFAFVVSVIAALLTSFYSWRLMFLTFWGTPRWAGSEHIQHAAHTHDDHAHDDPSTGSGHTEDLTLGYHPHESPYSMLVPLGLLSVGAVFAGFAFSGHFLDPEHGKAFWNGSLAFSTELMEAREKVPFLVSKSATIVMLLGLFTAWWAYIKNPSIPAKFTAQFDILYRFLLNKWYFDELYDWLFVWPSMALGRLLWHRGDEQTIDRFGPNGAASVVGMGSRMAVKFQSGYLASYALVMLCGLVAAVTYFMFGGVK